MRLRELGRIADVPALAWDALFPASYPFTRHAFLEGLERHRCVGARSGWEPAHLLVEDDAGQLIAAAPSYRKAHSYGEFVFDFGWAQASAQLGLPYYPKRVCAIPFTPVSGPRFGGSDAAALALLASGLDDDASVSSTHALFLRADDAGVLAGKRWLERLDLQFHWQDRGFGTFAGFLAQLRSDKRKKILRERRQVAESGIRFEHRAGDTLDEGEWRAIYLLYSNTYEERGQAPYLTLEFFLDFGRRAGTPLQLILGFDAHRLVAVAITLIGGDTLYGRHWGAAERYHSLHFETCFHQGIELCLARGLVHFDAGTQGEHKLARGFLPVLTRSMHRLADRRLHTAVADYLQRERAFVQSRYTALSEHGPYREEGGQAHG